jgi:hypothetical protein
MHPIFIPSKARVDNAKFIDFLKEQGCSATIVIEKEDEQAYRNKFGPLFKYLILPESNQGITYVRNFIKSYTEEIYSSGTEDSEDYRRFWMCDDDISNLYYREGTKMVKSGLNVLLGAERQMQLNPSVALLALDYQQLAWSAGEKEINYDSFCDVCVLHDNKLTKGMRYDAFVEGKEDRDFAMQVIKANYNTARTTLYAFAAPKNGSNKGGLKEIFYDAGREETCADRMAQKWGPEICSRITKDDGRPDVKIHWKKINSPQLGLF